MSDGRPSAAGAAPIPISAACSRSVGGHVILDTSVCGSATAHPRRVASAMRATPRRIHGVCRAITATARSERRIEVRGPGVGVDASSASADPGRGTVAIDRQELPGARNAAQLDAAAVLEAGARADHQVAHGARDQNFAGARLAEDPRRDVYCDPADVVVEQFAFAGVDAHADLDAQGVGVGRNASAQRIACVGPSNVARWPSPVFFTTVPQNRSVSSAVISPKRCSTARHRSSPRRRGVLRRRDDVGEQNGAQGAM